METDCGFSMAGAFPHPFHPARHAVVEAAERGIMRRDGNL